MRICAEREGRRCRVQLGQAQGDEVAWGWEIIGNPEDLAWMALDASYTSAVIEKQTAAVISQSEARRLDLEGKLQSARRMVEI